MKLYDYQQAAVDATDNHKKGILVLPTGTGKTMIQAAIIEKDIQNNNKKFGVYVVLVPRIILSYQLFTEDYKYNLSKGIECKYHFLHSGTKLDIRDLEKLRNKTDIKFSQINSTTSSIELTSAIETAKSLDLPIIIFSTYHSAERIEESRKFSNSSINIIMNDEAHYLVQNQFYPIIDKIETDRQYFFTATLRVNESDDDTNLDDYESQEGRGMFNVESYGRVIYKLLPRDAIEMGKMVRPRVHFVKTDGVKTDEDFDTSFSKVIHNTFNKQIEHFRINHPNIVPKIIVATRGSSDIKTFLDSEEYTLLREMGVDIFAIMSDEEKIIGEDINGEKVTRTEFLKKIREVGEDKTKLMLVLHYDILTEGIDVPGLTSCMPIRNLSKSKFIQTLGRCSRLDIEDRKKLENGEIDWTDVENMNKPYSYVILPQITLTNKEDMRQIRSFVLQLRDYGFNPFENIVGEFSPFGLPEEEDLETASNPDRRLIRDGNIIEYFIDEFEDDRVARLSEEEQFIENLN